MNLKWMSPASAFDLSYFRQIYLWGLAIMLWGGGYLGFAPMNLKIAFWILFVTALFGIFTRLSLLLLMIVSIRICGFPPFANILADYYLDVGLILMATRSGDVFTIDGLLQAQVRGDNKDIDPPKASVVYAWPMRLIWMTGLVALLSAGPSDLLTLSVFLALYAVSFLPLSALIHNWATKMFPQPLFVIYDGGCRLCRRTVAALNSLDEFGRIIYIDGKDVAELKRFGLDDVDSAALAKDIHILKDGRVFLGFAGYREMVKRITVLWLLLPFLYVPLIERYGQKTYRYVADDFRSKATLPEFRYLKWTDPPVGKIDFIAPAAIFFLLLAGHVFNL